MTWVLMTKKMKKQIEQTQMENEKYLSDRSISERKKWLHYRPIFNGELMHYDVGPYYNSLDYDSGLKDWRVSL